MSKKLKKKTIFVFSFTLLIFILLESILRYFGFCNAPLYIQSRDFEYIYAPNQRVMRFGNKIITNEYSMRNYPLSISDSIRILLIGDSVINGGNHTDHDSLASSLTEKWLSIKFNKPVRVLNISAGSWGPDNGAAFIKKFGNFDASLIILVFSSHDLYDNMKFERIVGSHPSFPNKQTPMAIQELVSRYIIPKFFRTETSDNLFINKKSDVINPGWKFFADYATGKKIPVIAYLHAEREEVRTKRYNDQGQKLLTLLRDLNIPTYKELEHKVHIEYYRDNFHYNNRGQKFLSSNLNRIISEKMRRPN